VRARRRPAGILAALLAAVVVALAAGGCGANDKTTTGTEGEYVNAGDAVYQVQLSRLLNPNSRPDDNYLQGQAPVPGNEQYLGVFVTIENDGKQQYLPPGDMKVVDTQGNEYLPIQTSGGGFGLEFGQPIPPKQKAPPPDSPAVTGPEGGALVLFRIKEESATDNLPLHLEIPAPGGKQSSVTLDI
jgi:hypothetical protein